MGNGEALILNGQNLGAYFVFNISDDFKMNGPSSISLTGGLDYSDVLFNIVGTKDVAFSGGGNSAVATGILLAPNAKLQFSPGQWTGELIGGKDISLVSGAQAHWLAPTNTVPEPASMILFGAGFLAAAVRKRLKV